MKEVSIPIPDCGPFGETFFEAKERAMLTASLVNNPSGGNVDTVFTVATQRLEFDRVAALSLPRR